MNAQKKKRSNWIPVTTAILKRNGKVLLGQRPEGHSLAGVWEFPGGKIEIGESPEQALKRELSEELGITAEIGPLKLAATHNYSDTGIILLFYEVSFWKGELKSVHHTELKWVTPEELKDLTLPEANEKILDTIIKAIRG